MAARRKTRILAFQALYAWDVGGAPLEDLLSFPWVEEEKLQRLGEDGLAFARLMLSGTLENIDAIDAQIKARLEHWDFSRLQKVDLAVLRLSVYSLLFQRDIAPAIIIEEAIGLCQEFGTPASYRFVNGILDTIKNAVQGNAE